MKMQTLPRSVLLTLLIGFGASAIAQDAPPTPGAPVLPLPTTPGMPPAENVEELADELDTQTPEPNIAVTDDPDSQTLDAETDTARQDDAAPPLPGAEPALVTRSDGEILHAFKVLSEAEISQAELAVEEASSQEVKDAAQQTIDEYSSAIEQIDAVGAKVGVDLVENSLSAELLERSEAATDDLQGLSGAEFECSYLQHKAETRFALMTLDQELLPFAKSFSVRNFLAETAPKFEHQALAAREIRNNLDSCG